MNRRKYLLAVGGTGSAGLAGCSALTDGTNSDTGTPRPTLVDGPAQFTDFKIETPETATVDTTVEVTVSGFNYGTEPGNFSGVLGTVEGATAVSKPIELTNVKSGKREETTVELSFTASDNYVLGVVDSTRRETESKTLTSLEPKARTQLTVGPKTAAVGESFDLDSGLRVTLTNVTYRQGTYYAYATGFMGGEKATSLFSTSSKQILALLRFEVENTGTESASFGPTSFTVSDGALLTDLRGYNLSDTTDIKGTPLRNTQVDAGQRITGWFLAQVSRNRAKNGVTVGWQRDANKTPPERSWTVESAELPSFSLQNWSVGSKQSPGTYSHHFTVKNTGRVKTRFRGMLDSKSKSDGADAWTPFRKLSGTIAPGKTMTIDIQETNPYLGTNDYRVRPFGPTRSVTIQRPTLSFGEKAVVPNGTIRISKVQTHSSYTTENEWTGTESHTPYNGDKFAFAYVEFVPNSGDGVNMPDENDFSLKANGSTYSESGSLEGPITSPIEGRFYYQTFRESDIQAGKPWAGWVSFGVPSGVDASDATIVLETEYEDGTSGATWSRR